MDTLTLPLIKAARLPGLIKPISRSSVVVIEVFFKLASDRHRLDILRSVLDGCPGNVNVDFGVLPIHMVDPLRLHQHLFARPLVPRIHFEVSNSPGFIIDDEVRHVTDLTIISLDLITCEVVGAVEM
jgi:hypothetical protein